MHSKIFVIGKDSEISEDSLLEKALRFNGSIDHVVEHTGEDIKTSVDCLFEYFEKNEVKIKRERNTLRIDRDSYLDFRIRDKHEAVVIYLAELTSPIKERQLEAFLNLGYRLTSEERRGFLFYSEDNGLCDIDSLLRNYPNDIGDIELGIVQSFYYHC